MKKTIILFLATIIVACVSLTGCADYSKLIGYNEIVNARTLYKNLNSAHIIVTDKDRNMVTQDFTFMYNSDGNLVYSYYGTDGSTKYYEYNDGSKMSYSENGEWKEIPADDENYIVYTRDKRNSLTNEGVLFLAADSIAQTTMTTNDNGTKEVIVQYDVSRLNDSVAGQLAQIGTLKEFSTTFYIDAEGYCTSMTENGVVDNNGEESKVTYELVIENMNDIGKVEKVEKPV